MPGADDLMPAADLVAAGFAVTDVETEDGSVTYHASRNSVDWAVSLEFAEPGPELGPAWAETLEYVEVVAEPGEHVEELAGLGEHALYWDGRLFVRADPAMITVEVFGGAPDQATTRVLCEWLARRVLARLMPAAFHPAGAAQPPLPPAVPAGPAAEPRDQRTSEDEETRRLEASTEWLTRQVAKSLERDQKWLRYQIGKSGPVPDPELVESLAEVESALAEVRKPARVLAPAAPDHPLTSTWSYTMPGRQRRLLLRRWKDLVPGQAKVGEELFRQYDAPRQHGLLELLMALPVLDANPDAADDPAAVELAVWFHGAGADSPSGTAGVEAAVRQAWQVLRAAGTPDARVNEVIRLLRLQGTGHVPDADRNGRLLADILLCFALAEAEEISRR